jgi:hypothetical protein
MVVYFAVDRQYQGSILIVQRLGSTLCALLTQIQSADMGLRTDANNTETFMSKNWSRSQRLSAHRKWNRTRVVGDEIAAWSSSIFVTLTLNE